MKKIILLLVLMALMVGFKFNVGKDNKVLLKVGSSQITVSEFNERIKTLPPQYQDYYKTADGKKQLLDNIKKEFLVLEMAKKNSYQDNQDVLDQLEKLRDQVMVAVFLRDRVEKMSGVKEREMKKYYKENKKDFKSKDQVKASHILVKEESEAKNLIVKLDKGADFGKLATDYSLDPSGKSNNGELGWFSKGQMVKPFENAAFSLKKGTYTKTPVQTQYGWHIILVTDTKKAKDLEYKEVKEDIKRLLTQKRQKELLEELISKAETEIEVQDHAEQLLLKKD